MKNTTKNKELEFLVEKFNGELPECEPFKPQPIEPSPAPVSPEPQAVVQNENS